MKIFALKLVFFLTPFTVLIIAGFAIAWRVGVALPQAAVIQMQSDNHAILYDSSSRNMFAYKEVAINRYQPRILVLGSSRATLFRAELFGNDPDAFYNGFVAAADLGTIYELWTRIDVYPDILLLELNSTNFRSQFHDSNIYRYDVDLGQIEFSMGQSAQFWQQLINGQMPTRTLINELQIPMSDRTRLGISAIQSDLGLRYDGSQVFPYSRQPITIPTQHATFEAGEKASPIALALVADILQTTQAEDITVIAYFPPYSPAAFAQLTDAPGYHQNAARALESLFSGYDNAQFFDFTNPNPLNINNDMMLDYWHMSERATLMLYLEMLRQNPDVLGQFSDEVALRQQLEASSDPKQVFD
ncbi:MAG: hypothetical protein Q9P44_14950 [Anaerolineae bacterium]|nr:hypothetical protein [Anaerolineae bacterium]